MQYQIVPEALVSNIINTGKGECPVEDEDFMSESKRVRSKQQI
jgi:hypothetical protein